MKRQPRQTWGTVIDLHNVCVTVILLRILGLLQGSWFLFGALLIVDWILIPLVARAIEANREAARRRANAAAIVRRYRAVKRN